MALQDDNREAFAGGFDPVRLKQMIVLHRQVGTDMQVGTDIQVGTDMQVGTSRTFLLIEVDRLVDEWGEDSLEVHHTRFEQHP